MIFHSLASTRCVVLAAGNTSEARSIYILYSSCYMFLQYIMQCHDLSYCSKTSVFKSWGEHKSIGKIWVAGVLYEHHSGFHIPNHRLDMTRRLPWLAQMQINSWYKMRTFDQHVILFKEFWICSWSRWNWQFQCSQLWFQLIIQEFSSSAGFPTVNS